jgi:hypothetical protein
VNAGTRIWPPTLKKDPRLDATTTAPRTPCGQPDTSSPTHPRPLHHSTNTPNCRLVPFTLALLVRRRSRQLCSLPVQPGLTKLRVAPLWALALPAALVAAVAISAARTHHRLEPS